MKIERKHIGARVIIRLLYSSLVHEDTIDEISPNGVYVKLSGSWKKMDDYDIEDILDYPSPTTKE